MQIAICDDIREDALHIQNLLKTYAGKKHLDIDITIFESGESFLHGFSSDDFDLIFLDIYMTGLTGMETAQKIREIDKKCAIIFTTTSTSHGAESYAVNATYYLLKPIASQDFASAMERCQSLLHRHGRALEVMENRTLTKILLSDILYIEVFGRRCEIHKKNSKITTNLRLSELEAQVGEGFIRCHRCYLINLDYVHDCKDGNLVLKNGQEIPIGKTYKSTVNQLYDEYILSLIEG